MEVEGDKVAFFFHQQVKDPGSLAAQRQHKAGMRGKERGLTVSALEQGHSRSSVGRLASLTGDQSMLLIRFERMLQMCGQPAEPWHVIQQPKEAQSLGF